MTKGPLPEADDQKRMTGNDPVEAQTFFATVALTGETNAGKSTLLNKLMGRKLAPVNHKVQTTRQPLWAVLTRGSRQLALIDTAGVREPRHTAKSPEALFYRAARAQAGRADLSVWVVDARRKRLSLPERAVDLVVLNKIDRLPRAQLLPLAEQARQKGFHEIFMVSARSGDGVSRLKAYLFGQCRPGPFVYERRNGSITPWPEIAAELTRAGIMKFLHQEIPYCLSVRPVSWRRSGSGVVVRQQIVTTEASHRAIIIGAGGQTLRRIGVGGRHALAAAMQCKVEAVSLFLTVTVAGKAAGGKPKPFRDPAVKD